MMASNGFLEKKKAKAEKKKFGFGGMTTSGSFGMMSSGFLNKKKT